MFQALASMGIDPASCRSSFSYRLFRITHRRTQSYFELTDANDHFAVQWGVTDGRGTPGNVRCPAWTDVNFQLGVWAAEVCYVTNTPDLWKELKRAPKVFALVQRDETGNSAFTKAERTEIANQLDAIKDQVREGFQLTFEQLSVVNERLDDAKRASERLGRKDWLLMFYGAMVSTAITDAVPPGVVQTVLAMAIHGIAHIFGIGGPPSITA